MHTNTTVGAEFGITYLLALLIAKSDIDLDTLPAMAASMSELQPGDGAVRDPAAFAEVMAEAEALINRTVTLATSIRRAMDDPDQGGGTDAPPAA